MHSHDNVIVFAFSDEQTERLTGLTKRQLRYWDSTDFFKPSFAFENRRVAFSRIYSFKDIAALRTISSLRNEYQVPLQHLRQVAQRLQHLEDRLWISMTLYVINRRVHLYDEETDTVEDAITRQAALKLPLRVVKSDTEQEVRRLLRRSETDVGRITRSRNLSHNAWVVAGTRVPVATIKRFAKEGYSVKDIQSEYPTLTEADIRAAIEYEGNGVAA